MKTYNALTDPFIDTLPCWLDSKGKWQEYLKRLERNGNLASSKKTFDPSIYTSSRRVNNGKVY